MRAPNAIAKDSGFSLEQHGTSSFSNSGRAIAPSPALLTPMLTVGTTSQTTLAFSSQNSRFCTIIHAMNKSFIVYWLMDEKPICHHATVCSLEQSIKM